MELLLKLRLQIDKILLNEETVALYYERECRHIMIDGDLSPGENTRANVWWAIIKNHCTVLGKVALTMPSIFHGPPVESSFSMIGNILHKKSG